ARLVSVSFGAEINLTLIFGYAFSNAEISTVRGSVPLVVIGLAHQVIEPEVALPLAAELDDPLLLLVLPPELHALSATIEAAAVTTAANFMVRLFVISGWWRMGENPCIVCSSDSGCADESQQLRLEPEKWATA
ncbi:MAG: hypothetical protein ABI310_01925, partial [Microbacteriaceae bacterium]